MKIKAIFDPKVEFIPNDFEFTDPIFTIISNVEFNFSNKEGIVLCETSPLHLLFTFVENSIELFSKKIPVEFGDLCAAGRFYISLKNKNIFLIEFLNAKLNFEVEANVFYLGIYEYGESLFSDLIFKFNGYKMADELKNMKKEFNLLLEKLNILINKIR